MSVIVQILYKLVKRFYNGILMPFDYVLTFFIFYANGVRFSSIVTRGCPRVAVAMGGQFFIGKGFRINNRVSANPIGRFNRCSFAVGAKGKLQIGERVGMSSVAIVCQQAITIGNYVNIGGNVVIYDTDFHSTNPKDRLSVDLDRKNTNIKPVIIGNNVFIGAHTTILKGVTIGNNSIVGACSVVTRSIPENQIWAGNPAKFIKTIHGS